jgi:SAM-dependent methyltransferase
MMRRGCAEWTANGDAGGMSASHSRAGRGASRQPSASRPGAWRSGAVRGVWGGKWRSVLRKAGILLGLLCVVAAALPFLAVAYLAFAGCGLFIKNPRSPYDRLIDRYPLLYEIHSRFFNFPLLEDTFRNIPPARGRVLHLACGTGLGAKIIRNGNPRVIELDMNVKRLCYGLKKLRLQRPVAGDAVALPFRENAFDVIVLPVSLHHIIDLDGLFRECERVMREDGRFIIYDPASLRRRTCELWNTFHDGRIWIFDKVSLVREIEVLAARRGLKIGSVRYYRQPSLQNYNLVYSMCDVLVELVREPSACANKRGAC